MPAKEKELVCFAEHYARFFNDMNIGCQFSLYPMTDRFIDIIQDSIGSIKNEKHLRFETDDISTMLIGTSEKIFSTLQTCFLKASKKTNHVALNVTFSKGCPGEPDEPCCHQDTIKQTTQREYIRQAPDSKKLSGIPVAAQFALYPMNDTKYMDIIYKKIEESKKFVSVKPKHFCTRIEGDAKDVFKALQYSFDSTSQVVSHVVMTATISKKGVVSKIERK